ncbi:hypothetical protein AHF37_00913 [Paragonimus kellicotti]|nr:hypothetical protein AHF37_00913 [Paragonimus kellicotti]
MACLAENMNASQFFFTLGAALELTGKHTLFGKVAGETLFNMLRLGEGDVGSDERPHRLHRIVNTKVVLNPYDDIVPRQLVRRIGSVKDTEDDSDKVTQRRPILWLLNCFLRLSFFLCRNFSLLSFGEEAEEEEHVTTVVSEKLRKKGKSAHDLLSDPRLSSQPVIVNEEDREAVARASLEAEKEAELRRRRRQQAKEEDPESDEAKAKRIAALREEAEQLRREILQSKRLEAQRRNQLQDNLERKEREVREREQAEADALARWEARELMGDEVETKNKPIVVDPDTFSAELAGYKAKAKKNKQGSDREAETMALLSKFTSRLRSVVDPTNEDTEQKKFSSMDNWMNSQLISEIPAPTKQVIDPTMPNPDRYDLYDPRNPLNVRKRGGDAPVDTGPGVGKRNRRP